MTSKQAKADVIPVRQTRQFTCMAASMSMALGALGIDVDEDTVNKVMDCRPMQGASWEDAMACSQYFGVRATLVTPCTIGAVKAWTDAGSPVLIGWNPEGRQWSHASLIFDVTDTDVHIADPNIPNPDETVRVVPLDEFYKKWFESRGDFLVRRSAMALEREVTKEGKPTMGKTARMVRKAIWPSVFIGIAEALKGKKRTDRKPEKHFEHPPSPSWEKAKSPLRMTRDYGETMKASDYADKLAKYERGEDVPLEDLPEAVQENVKNPPESVKKVREDMEKQSEEGVDLEDVYTDCDDTGECTIPPEGPLGVGHYAAFLRSAKFERGKSMTVDEVAEVVGPEFKENVENPPESVAKLREELQKKACGCDAKEDDEEEGTEKTAASGLYGVTKDLEGACLSAGKRLASSVKKIAREIYSKDEETPGFLSEHGKRTGNRAAKLLVTTMKEMGPGSKLKASKTAGPARTGLYGYKERTAKIALEACSALYHQAGLIAGDLHGRRTAHYDGVTGFFKNHSKTGKCGYSALLLEAYPSAPAPKIASHMIDPRTMVRYLTSADFLASAEVEDEDKEEAGTEKKANMVQIGDARRFIDALALLMSGDFEGSGYDGPEVLEEEMIGVLKRGLRSVGDSGIFIYELARYGRKILLPLLSSMKPDPTLV